MQMKTQRIFLGSDKNNQKNSKVSQKKKEEHDKETFLGKPE